MVSREVLEQTIRDYSGTLLYVSHDRYFINQTATRILELKNNTFINYIGNYDYYLEKRDLLSKDAAMVPVSIPDEPAAKQDWQSQKEAAARQRKLENDFRKTENRITALEERKSEIEGLLSDATIFYNVAKLMELHREQEAIDTELSSLYETWELLGDQLS